MKTLLTVLTFTLATLSQSAFAMYYACKDTNDAVVVAGCSPTSTIIEITNDPFYASYLGYSQGSLRVLVKDTYVSIGILSDQTTGGKIPLPMLIATCTVKATSPIYQIAQLLAASNIPTYDLTNRTGMVSVKFKATKLTAGDCTSLEYTKGWH